MRKLFGFLLICILIASSFSLIACNKEDRDYSLKIDDGDIAKLTLFSFNGDGEGRIGLMNLGHAFLSIENISDEPIELLHKNISVGETISIGTWSILEHFGIWYNVESNYIVEHNKYDGRVSITIGIDNEDISTLSNYMSNNDKWNPIYNCSKFALTLWNTVAENSEKINKPIIYTPTYIAKEIKKFDSYETNRAIPTEETIGYFNNSTYISFQIEGEHYESV